MASRRNPRIPLNWLSVSAIPGPPVLDCVSESKSVSGIAAGGTGNDFLAGLTLCSFHSYSAVGVASTTKHQ
jgi:hypothetical protein